MLRKYICEALSRYMKTHKKDYLLRFEFEILAFNSNRTSISRWVNVILPSFLTYIHIYINIHVCVREWEYMWHWGQNNQNIFSWFALWLSCLFDTVMSVFKSRSELEFQMMLFKVTSTSYIKNGTHNLPSKISKLCNYRDFFLVSMSKINS